MTIQSMLSLIFNDEVQKLNNSFRQVKSDTASAPLSGYVHLLDQGNAIFITDEHQSYLITIEFTLYFRLKTGDRLQARVSYNSDCNNKVVCEIIKVEHVNYDQAPMHKTNRSLDLSGNTINLGTSIMIPATDNTDIANKINQIAHTLPDDIAPILLSFDGRPTNYDLPTTYFTKPNYTNKEKLMTCLLAFFHAKQQADIGKSVVLFIDSLDKMFFIFNNCMQAAGTIDPNMISTAAVMDYENILYCSGNLQAGGSLTLIGTHQSGVTPQQLQITDRLHQIMDRIIEL